MSTEKRRDTEKRRPYHCGQDGGALTPGDRCPSRKGKRHQGCTEARPCEDTAGRWPGASQGQWPWEKPICRHLALGPPDPLFWRLVVGGELPSWDPWPGWKPPWSSPKETCGLPLPFQLLKHLTSTGLPRLNLAPRPHPPYPASPRTGGSGDPRWNPTPVAFWKTKSERNVAGGRTSVPCGLWFIASINRELNFVKCPRLPLIGSHDFTSVVH